MIELQPCPRCGGPRTVSWDNGIHFCANCHFRWRPATDPADAAAAQFTTAELERLETYRRAGDAGFFNDGAV